MGIKIWQGFVILLALLVVASSCGKSNEQLIDEQVRKMNSELPVKYGDNVTLVKVEAGENEIISTYEMRGVDRSKISDDVTSRLKSVVVLLLKRDRDVVDLFKKGIVIKIICTDDTQDEFLRFTISKEDL